MSKLYGFCALLLIFNVFYAANCDPLDENIFLTIFERAIKPEIRKRDPPFLFRYSTIALNAAFDAIVPYMDRAVGICSSIPKRPIFEQSIRNKNIAVAYAVLRVTESVLPKQSQQVENILWKVQLNPYDRSLDLTSPIGIGNYAARKVLEIREHDGANQLGDANMRKYNRYPYEVYTNYIPKNTAYEFTHIYNWQPNIELNEIGEFTVQQFIVAQAGNVLPYAVDVNDYDSPPPLPCPPSMLADIKYRQQANDILNASKNLNDYSKLTAEHFDDKVEAFFPPIEYMINKNFLQYDDYFILALMSSIANFDATIVAWKMKVKYDTVRPYSAIRYLYHDEPIEAWGGPGVGTVNDMLGKEWTSYIRTGPHPDYPSGTTCYCEAYFQTFKEYFNSDIFNYRVFKPKGSSVIEPHITPANDFVLSYDTLSDYIRECGISRVYGGVHFPMAVEEARRLCPSIGTAAYKFVMDHVNGVRKKK